MVRAHPQRCLRNTTNPQLGFSGGSLTAAEAPPQAGHIPLPGGTVRRHSGPASAATWRRFGRVVASAIVARHRTWS